MYGDEPSEELRGLAFLALEHGIDSIRANAPLVTFAIVERPDGRDLHRFQAETLEESQQRARDHVRASPGAKRAAVAWAGKVTLDKRRTAAVVVEAYEDGAAASFVFAQCYRRGGRLRKFATIGDAGVAGTAEPLF
jgi:hypothetical protein